MNAILVIEDESELLDSIVDLLCTEGYHAFGAVSGQQGILLAKEHTPDLILCDVMMPEVNGYEVLYVLRALPETLTVPFIFLTALSAKKDIRRGMNLGADDYLTKPFTDTELLDAVRTQLRKHQDQVHEQDKALDVLREHISKIVPHELRTPLMSIVGFANMLKLDWRTLPPEVIDEMLTEIEHSGQRLQRLVENYSLLNQLQLLDYDHTTRDIFWSEEGSAINVIAMTAAQNRAAASGRGADLKVDIEPCLVPIYVEYLSKMIGEILDNAFKFSVSGTPVAVQGRCDETYYVLTVTDQGHGMTKEHIAYAGAFSQFDRDRYEQQGLGLGLAIVTCLAEVLGGHFALESKPGKGTTARIDLPLSKGAYNEHWGSFFDGIKERTSGQDTDDQRVLDDCDT